METVERDLGREKEGIQRMKCSKFIPKQKVERDKETRKPVDHLTNKEYVHC